MFIAIIILCVVLIIIGFVFISKNKSDENLTKFLIDEGWTELPPEKGRKFGFSGQSEDVTWTLESIRSSNRHASGKTVTKWKTSQPLSKTAVFVGPKLPAIIKKINLDGNLVKLLLESALGDDAANIVGLQFLEIKDHPLNSKYSIVTNGKESAISWIEPGQPILVNWKDQSSIPFIARYGKELLIQLDGSIKDPEILKSMVSLGIKLTKRQPEDF